ncbi:hypothetical protein NIES4071_16630 [Calothrix sp. NIES-4071]|nr:hypothetical protein NIES4071_16630 [Calothrix sp. NIES-4071]BAZ55997.1 hypothetical protein NIES4105_16580 [Calothrix sp. NIES-4105]
MRSHQISQSVNPSAPVQVKSHSESISNYAGYLVIAIPVIVLLSIVGYKKYKITTHRNRIAFLERLWHINIDEKTH